MQLEFVNTMQTKDYNVDACKEFLCFIRLSLTLSLFSFACTSIVDKMTHPVSSTSLHPLLMGGVVERSLEQVVVRRLVQAGGLD